MSYKMETWSCIIAQVYILSAVHCQVTRYSQRVLGYLTRYSVSANEISFDKNIQSECVFQLMLGLEEQYSPSPFSDFNSLFEGHIGVFLQNLTLKYDLCF